MVPVEEGGEGEEAELPGEGLVAGSSTSRGSITRRGEEEREGVVARAAQGAEGVGEQGGGNQRRPSDQGLEKLERANGLLLEGDAGANVDDVKHLLKQSRAAFFEEHRRSLSQAGAAVGAAAGGVVVEPWRGAPVAATVCIASEVVFPEAIALVRWFCSKYVASLCEVARVAEGEARKLEKEGKNKRKARTIKDSTTSGAGAGAGTSRAARVLRVLITAFNAFLRHCSRGLLYSKTSHVHVLDIAVSLTRKVIEKLAGVCAADPAAGMAAARLRGLTATACFAPLSVLDAAAGGGGAEEGPPNFDNLKRIGNRDVQKLFVCISGGKAKKDVQYLRHPGNCVEAIGALRSVAMAAPQVYHIIAEAFAAALRCMTLGTAGAHPEGGEGEGEGEEEWGGRPALKDAAVRHTLFASSSHLADSLGKSPDASCIGAHGILVSALKACYIMRGPAPNNQPLPLALTLAAGPDGVRAGTPVAAVEEGEVAAADSSPMKLSKMYPASGPRDKAIRTVREGTAGQKPAATSSAAARAATPAAETLPRVPPPSAKDVAAPTPTPAIGTKRGGAHGAKAVEVDDADPTMSGGKGGGGSGGGVGRKRPRSPSSLQEEGDRGINKTNLGTRGPASPPLRPPPLPPVISNTAVDIPRQTSAAAPSATTRRATPLAGPQSGSATPVISNHADPGGTGAAAAEASVAPPSVSSVESPLPPPPSLPASPSRSTTTKPSTSRASDSPAVLGVEEERISGLGLMASLFGEEDGDAGGDAEEESTLDAAKVAVAAAKVAAQVAAATADAGFPEPEQRMTSTDSPPPPPPPPARAAAAIPATSAAAGATKRTESAPTAKKSYPPLKSAPEKKPTWQDGDRYQVVLGDSFYASSGNGGDGGGSNSDGPSGQEQYVHLKYDFVPARTNLDVPATLRQRPLTAAEGRWNNGRGGSGSAGRQQQQHQQQRWAAELEYASRDPTNSEPVRFSGDATRAQDVECVLVFDGKQFVMDRVSVVGGLKNLQEFSDPGPRGAGEPTPEAAMAKKKKDIKGMRSMKEKEEKKKAKAAEKAKEMAAKAAARAAAKEAKAAERARAREKAVAQEPKAIVKRK